MGVRFNPGCPVHRGKVGDIFVNAYSKTYEVRFSDIDANRHVNHAVYVNACGDMRYQFFAEHGFPPERFEQMGVGPVYTKITTLFLREVLLGEIITITFVLTGLSPSGALWNVHHDIFKSNGKRAVSIDMEGAILDLTTRKPVPPATELMQVFQAIPRSHNLEVLPEMRRPR
jgi:acyl-CoA thioester hydrolase